MHLSKKIRVVNYQISPRCFDTEYTGKVREMSTSTCGGNREAFGCTAF